jgi:DNA-binding GntR family transcriptional regulator
MVALSFRGEITAGEHRVLFDCALRRDSSTAKTALKKHITGCVKRAIASGTLRE